jgi:hypothetical protein
MLIKNGEIRMEQTIYDELKTFGSVNDAWKKKGHSNHSFKDYVAVADEVERVKKEINAYMSGGVLLQAEESHFDDESGEKVIDQEAVYYNPTTQTDLLEQIDTELDKADILSIMKDGLTWEEFKSKFNESEE